MDVKDIITPEDLKHLIDLKAEKVNRSPATVCFKIMGAGNFYSRLAEGKDVHLRTATKILKALSSDWPEGLEWPRDIMRPANEINP